MKESRDGETAGALLMKRQLPLPECASGSSRKDLRPPSMTSHGRAGSASCPGRLSSSGCLCPPGSARLVLHHVQPVRIRRTMSNLVRRSVISTWRHQASGSEVWNSLPGASPWTYGAPDTQKNELGSPGFGGKSEWCIGQQAERGVRRPDGGRAGPLSRRS